MFFLGVWVGVDFFDRVWLGVGVWCPTTLTAKKKKEMTRQNKERIAS